MLVRRVWVGTAPSDAVDRQTERYRSYASAGAQVHWQGEQLMADGDAGALAEELAAVMARAGVDALNLRIHVPGVSPATARDQIGAMGDVVAGSRAWLSLLEGSSTTTARDWTTGETGLLASTACYWRDWAYSMTRVTITSSLLASDPQSKGGWGSYSIISWAASAAVRSTTSSTRRRAMSMPLDTPAAVMIRRSRCSTTRVAVGTAPWASSSA